MTLPKVGPRQGGGVTAMSSASPMLDLGYTSRGQARKSPDFAHGQGGRRSDDQCIEVSAGIGYPNQVTLIAGRSLSQLVLEIGLVHHRGFRERGRKAVRLGRLWGGCRGGPGLRTPGGPACAGEPCSTSSRPAYPRPCGRSAGRWRCVPPSDLSRSSRGPWLVAASVGGSPWSYVLSIHRVQRANQLVKPAKRRRVTRTGAVPTRVLLAAMGVLT